MSTSSGSTFNVHQRPTIAVNGQDDLTLSQGLLGMNVTETTLGLYRCELVVGNWGPLPQGGTGFSYFDRKLLDFGKTLTISVGGTSIFEGQIYALIGRFPEEGQVEFAVYAEDRFQELRMTRRTQTFENTTDSDLFSTIANAHGLTPNIDVQGPQHTVIAQVNQSDLALLRERARAVDAEVWMDGTTLHAQARSRRKGATVTLGYKHELHEVVVSADLANQRTALTVSGWDVSAKSAIQYQATDSALGSELGSNTSGSSIVQSAFGARKDAIVHSVPWTQAEAQARAEAHYRAFARTFVSVRGVADTDPNLRVGAYVNLVGVGPLFEGSYYVTEVTHIFDGVRGLRTEFSAESPGMGQPQ
jgi:phage protein D